MNSPTLRIIACMYMCLLLAGLTGYTQDSTEERHLKVALRMIGHRVLLSAQDSSSRVLPVVKAEDQYRIEFEAPFAFEPSELVKTVHQVVIETKIATNYLVEVEQCESKEIVYSYEVNPAAKWDIIPCKERPLPEDCYNLLIHLIPPPLPALFEPSTLPSPQKTTSYTDRPYLLYVVLLIGIIGFAAFWIWPKSAPQVNPHWIPLGTSYFDQRKAELIISEQKIELSSKEADLLAVLCESANHTVERAELLHKVWGDNGDYIGRTLDVFISKLRKKLAADPAVKIVNVRGVGYKLVLDTTS